MTIVHDSAVSRETALFISKLASPVWICASSFVLLFALVYTKKIQRFKYNWLWLFLPPVLFVYQGWQDNLFADPVPHTFGWISLFQDSLWTLFFFTYYTICCLTGIFLIYQYRKSLTGTFFKKQATSLFIGTLLTYLLTFVTEFLLPLFHVYYFVDMSALLAFCWSIGLVWAISKYQFLEISPITAASNILAAMSDALFLLDNRGQIVVINEAASQMLSLKRSELLGTLFFSFLSAEDHSRFPGGIREEVKGLEICLKTGAGRSIPVNLSISKIENKQQQIGYVCVARDITDSKRAKMELKESEQRYREFADSLPIASWETDPAGQPVPVRVVTRLMKRDGQITGFVGLTEEISLRKQMEAKTKEANAKLERQLQFTEALLSATPTPVFFKDVEGRYLGCNEAFTVFTGITQANLKGKTVWQTWPQEIAEVYYKMDRELITQQGHQRYETRMPDYKGLTHDVVFEKDVFRDEHGQVNGIVGTFVDITEIRQVEEQVRKMNTDLEKRVSERTALLSSLLDSIPDIIFFKDSQGIYLGCNPPFACYVKKDREEIIGKSDYDLFSLEKADALRKHDILVIEQNRLFRTESLLDFPDGHQISVDMQKAPLIDINGRIIGILGMARDITDDRRYALELRQAKESAETANQAKSQFLANMSHEIRTPLNGILGFLNLLSDTALSDEQSEYIRSAQSASQVLLHLINEILDFSRIEAAKTVLQLTLFNLRETVEETAFLLAPLAFEKKLELITFIDKDVPEEVIGDQARLKQVLINLIENAIKFTGEGEIFIKVNNMNCGNATEPAIIQFEVQDTGIGIDRNDLEKLFLPFSQLDSSLTRRYGGTGLGLAISKRLIEMMGGKICLESEKAKGTKFSFSVHFKQTEKIEPFQKFDDKLLNVPVLIVENNATQCQVLRQYLNEAGCEVVTTPHYQTALEMLTAANSRRYRFILVASQLINSGQQTLADVISSPSGLEPCDLIILISSNNYPDQTGLPVKSGEPNSYMTLNKPVKKAQLLACLSGKLTSQVLSVSEAKPLPVTQNYTFNDFTILVVEDNELNRKLMLKLLNKWGYRCEIAKNGHEAFLACQTKKYNLILMDCQMPVMDGYEAATAIRKTEGINKHTVIIGVTAHALSSDRQKCLSAGMDDYISKPFDYIKLAEMLEKYKNAS